jgi:hypothetical protein
MIEPFVRTPALTLSPGGAETFHDHDPSTRVLLYADPTMRAPLCVLLPLCLLTLACREQDRPAAGATDASSGATVVGTITLPSATTGKPYSVRILGMAGAPSATPVGEASGTTAGATTLQYTIADVPAGSYFVLAFVDIDSSGGQSSTPGDQAGWFGHTGDGNPPASPNATVPASGMVRFDFSLVVR